MPYLDPNSRGFLTADEIIRRAQMSRAGQNYYDALARTATEARDRAMRNWQQQQADLYMRQHFPQYVPGSEIGTPMATVHRGRHRIGGGDYYNISGPAATFTPQIIAQGPPAPMVAPSNMSVVMPVSTGYTGPRSVEEVRYDQLMAGTAPEPLTYPGYMPVSHGYMYSGTKEGFTGPPDEE